MTTIHGTIGLLAKTNITLSVLGSHAPNPKQEMKEGGGHRQENQARKGASWENLSGPGWR